MTSIILLGIYFFVTDNSSATPSHSEVEDCSDT